MSKVVKIFAFGLAGAGGTIGKIAQGIALVGVGVITGNFQLVLAGVARIGSALFTPGANKNRAAAAAQLQLGEQPRQAVLGRAALAGSLVDAFNYGGKYNTDWEVLVLALADHRCDALEGFFVDDTYHAFIADGTVAGFNSQLQVYWRSGTWDQTVPAILTTNGPGWTANDRGRSVAYVVVAYKADKADAETPVWPGGRPRFRWVVRGLRCYQARKDTTAGGSGAHRWSDPATWQWTENVIDIRYNWVRGIYAGDRVNEPQQLLVGRGLSEVEAPPANVFARANLCDELVGGAARYRIGGLVAASESFIEVENDLASACAGVIVQPEGAVEIDPGEARATVAHFTDDDLIVGSQVRWSDFLSASDDGWINTVVASFTDPGLRWSERSAPANRDLADIAADGGPREQQLRLALVTNVLQAGRVAEITRRFGRLWGRAQVTLPPRFAGIEEGDWITWQSQRHFGGATFTFRVEGWGSDEGWRHQITLRQISASVFSDTAPLDDGVIASDQPPPPVVEAPGVAAWALAPVLQDGGGVLLAALLVTGAVDDPAAQLVVFETVQQVAAPDGLTVWNFAATGRPDLTRIEIPVAAGGSYYLAISYVVDGILGPRRVLGPVSAATVRYPDGTPIDELQPSEPDADVTATAQRSIAPQFPVIEIKQGEAGHTGNRAVTHVALRGTVVLSGGTWSLTNETLGTGDATIVPATGTVTLSGIVQSGSYTVRYLHTDTIATDHVVNVTFVPTAGGSIAQIKTGSQTVNNVIANSGSWQQIVALTIVNAAAGTANFSSFTGSYLDAVSGTGTAAFEARMLIDGVVVASVPSQTVVTGGVLDFADFSPLFEGTHSTAAGDVDFVVQMRRTSGTGTATMTGRLEPTIIAS